MSMIQKVAKNTIAIVVGNIVVKILALMISIYLARYLGVNNYGKYIFVITYLQFFGFIVSFGLDPLIIREIAKDYSITDKILSNALLIRLITSTTAIVLAIVGVYLLGYPTDTIFYIIIVSTILLFQGISYLIESLFQSKFKMEFSSIALIVSKIAFVILVIYLTSNHGTLLQIFFALILSEILRTAIDFYYSRNMVNLSIQINLNYWKQLLKEALPFVIGYAFYIIYYRIDILMLSLMKGDASIGFYSAAYKLTDPLLFLPGALAATLMPVMSNQYGAKKDIFKSTYLMGSRYIFILMLPITIGVWILSEKIIITLYGLDFFGSIFALQLLSGTVILNSLNSLQSSVLTSTNKQKLNTLAVGICCILNIFLNLIFIPKYSYVGAAFSTLISVLILYSIEFYFVYKYLSLQSVNKESIKSIVSSIIMGVVLIKFYKLNLIYLIFIGFISYVAAMVALKGFSKSDFEIMARFKHKT